MSSEIEMKLNLMKELGVPHPPHGEEQEFYQMVADGDVQGILGLREKYPGGVSQETEKGRLSDDPVRNEIYHLVANCTIVTRRCIAAGMPQEDAYSLSDMFIRRADKCRSCEEVRRINDEMSLEFAGRMKRVHSRDVSPAVRQAMSVISDKLHTRLTAAQVAESVGYDRTYLAALFRRETGLSVTQYILEQRVNAAKSLIAGGVSLSEISGLLGFSSQSHFCSRFRNVTGMTPGEFRRSLIGTTSG